MKSKMLRLLAALSAAFFIAGSALAQNPGTVTNHAFALGKGAGKIGYTSLLCGSAQLAVGQAAADPICQTITGDVTIDATGLTAIGATKVTSAMLNADVFSTAHSWGGQQTFVAPVLGTPASGVATNLTGTASGLTAGGVVANGVTRAMEAQGVARSVIGVAGNATANVADIQGTANQFLGVNSAGTSLAFNTMSQDCTLATGVITCTKTNNVSFTAGATAAAGQLPGELSTGSASAGNVGEYAECTLVVGSATALTTATPKTICTLAIPSGGDWDIEGTVYFASAASTSVTATTASLSGTTNTLDITVGKWGTHTYAAVVPGALTGLSEAVSKYRLSVSGATSVFLVGQATFTVGALSGWGKASARRAR